jgi:hypothetical protein
MGRTKPTGRKQQKGDEVTVIHPSSSSTGKIVAAVDNTEKMDDKLKKRSQQKQPEPNKDIIFFTQEDKELILKQFRNMSKVNHSGSFLDELFEEYRRFTEILIYYNGFSCCPSRLVDEMWHAHIICTKSYFAFCEKFNRGKGYIHHTPSTGFQSSLKEYRNTLVEYFSRWKCKPDVVHPNIWESIEDPEASNKKNVVVLDLTQEGKEEDHCNFKNDSSRKTISSNNHRNSNVLADLEIETISDDSSDDEEENENNKKKEKQKNNKEQQKGGKPEKDKETEGGDNEEEEDDEEDDDEEEEDETDESKENDPGREIRGLWSSDYRACVMGYTKEQKEENRLKRIANEVARNAIALPAYAIPSDFLAVANTSEYERVLKELIRRKIASTTAPYYRLLDPQEQQTAAATAAAALQRYKDSQRTKTTTTTSSSRSALPSAVPPAPHPELYKYIGFQNNCVFGPGSNMNGVFFCRCCARIWEYKVSYT